MASRQQLAELTAAEPDRIGGRFVVESPLGTGGMGAVYRVRDESTGAVLALKRMTWRGDPDDGDAAQLRFRREFHTMATLAHPRIVEVHDYGIADGMPYYTMELLDGLDLHDLDRVEPARACAILRDVASALAFLHARRLLHRDLAPRNVRCTSDGRAKLIDFGVLATTGISGDVAGTPPFIAPEAVHGRPLDHRYDLYGLGALAYRILTGRHAYPARAIDQLDLAWRQRPAPPSAIAPGVPAALDELVMALLAHDPLARPPGAAEVIDRLTVIGQLDRPAEIESSRGWIASGALVGRQREMAQIKRAVTRAHDGTGRAVVVEAPSGTGKTRLLRELAIEAQLAGTCVARADSDAAGRGPYGIVHELARALCSALPEEAEAAARPRAAMLARVIQPLRERLGSKPARPLGDPAEDRAQLQHELVEWVKAIAAVRPIALVVDDVQRCDEASAAVLATLAHESGDRKLLVAVALRSDEPPRAPGPLAALADVGQRIRLRGLDQAQIGELVRSLFGDVPNVARLARWMHRVAGGSPLHTTELARDLVERGTIRYVDGLWSIPEDPGREDLPRGLADAMDARVRALPGDARALGEVLSVHGGELALDAIVALAELRDEARVFAALDALAYDEVLVQGQGTWRFRHDGLREALLRNLDAERTRALHRRVGEALAAAEPDTTDEARDAEIGWHLLRGGDAAGGAARLERAGRALYEAQSFADCIAPLEAALDAARSPRVRLELLHMLLMAGCMADRKAALRHADACVQGFRTWAGADVATAASRLVGRHLGVVLGLIWASVRWLVKLGRGPNPYEAFRTMFIAVGYAATIHSLGFDFARCREMIELVRPVAIFKNRIPYAVYLITNCSYHFPRGEIGEARRKANRVLEILERDHLTPIREIDRRTGGGGARYILALSDVLALAPSVASQLAALRELDLKFFDVGARQAEIALHRMRGEEERASELEAEGELWFVRLGSIWQMEAFMPVVSSMGYALTRDMLGLRRTIEQLARMCDDGFCYQPFLELARAEYLRERGDTAGALAKLEPLVEQDYPMLLVAALPALAETLLARGEHARAREIAARGVAVGGDPETCNIHGKLRSARAHALAQAALGDHAAAVRELDAALAEAAPLDSPVLTGALHEARARVALAAGDSLAFHDHLASTEQAFRRSRNPALIGRAQRLAEAGTRHAERMPTQLEDEPATSPSSPGASRRGPKVAVVSTDAVTTPPPEARAWVSAVLSGCRGSSERATRALQLVVNEARGASGYLYLRNEGQLVLAAPAWGDEPPTELVRALARAARSPDELATVADVPRDDGAGKLAWKPIPLVLRIADAPYVIGAIAVLAGAMPLVDPPATLLEEIARELFEAGDVTHTRTTS